MQIHRHQRVDPLRLDVRHLAYVDPRDADIGARHELTGLGEHGVDAVALGANGIVPANWVHTKIIRPMHDSTNAVAIRTELLAGAWVTT